VTGGPVAELVVALVALLGEDARIRADLSPSGAAFVNVWHGAEFVVIEYARGQFCADYDLKDERFGRGEVRGSVEEAARDAGRLLGVVREPGSGGGGTSGAAAGSETWVRAAIGPTTATHHAVWREGRLVPVCGRRFPSALVETARPVDCGCCLPVSGGRDRSERRSDERR
jgi:hypothetical protein